MAAVGCGASAGNPLHLKMNLCSVTHFINTVLTRQRRHDRTCQPRAAPFACTACVCMPCHDQARLTARSPNYQHIHAGTHTSMNSMPGFVSGGIDHIRLVPEERTGGTTAWKGSRMHTHETRSQQASRRYPHASDSVGPPPVLFQSELRGDHLLETRSP